MAHAFQWICRNLPPSKLQCIRLPVPLSTHLSTRSMAKSRFEYVRQFEAQDACLPNCWIVVRIDGKAFHRFSDVHNYEKPNDPRGLGLMNCAAQTVLSEIKDLILAYGQSDEYSFVFRKNTKTYNRRASKLMTTIVSLFASAFVFHWPKYFTNAPLQYPPAFDGRVVLYPSVQNLQDYLSWRQADCHINNLYNTCFWNLVLEAGLTPSQAQERLKGTVAGEKNELLFSQFNINYNDLSQMYRKGTVVYWASQPVETSSDDTDPSSEPPGRNRTILHTEHCDIIGSDFWKDHPHLLGSDNA